MKYLHDRLPVLRIRLLAVLLLFMVGLTVDAAGTSPAADEPVTGNTSSQYDTANQGDPPEPGPDHVQLRRTVREYQTTILEMEKRGGVNDQKLSEKLIGLGRAYRGLGQNDKAIETFNRALQITRVNQGPETPRQLPVLELIIETNKATADWEALEENYQFYYWITRRVYADDAQELLKVIYRLASWHLQAYLTKYDPIPYKHLLQSEKLFQDAIDVMDKNYDPDDPRMMTALYGIINSNYHIVSHRLNSSNNTDDMKEIHKSNAIMSRVDNVSSMLIWQPLNYNEYEGRKVFKRIANILNNHHELPITDRATALVNIGDWYLIAGWRGTAMQHYLNAYRLLRNTNTETDLFNRLFVQPVRIPALTSDYRLTDVKKTDELERPYIKLSFDITVQGCASNIRYIEESDPDKFMLRRHAREYLYSSLFRPHISGDKAIRARNLTITLSGAVLLTGTDRKLVNYDRFNDVISNKRCHHSVR